MLQPYHTVFTLWLPLLFSLYLHQLVYASVTISNCVYEPSWGPCFVTWGLAVNPPVGGWGGLLLMLG